MAVGLVSRTNFANKRKIESYCLRVESLESLAILSAISVPNFVAKHLRRAPRPEGFPSRILLILCESSKIHIGMSSSPISGIERSWGVLGDAYGLEIWKPGSPGPEWNNKDGIPIFLQDVQNQLFLDRG